VTAKNLEDLIIEAGGAIPHLRAHKYDRADLPPEYNPALIIPQIPQEFSRWERESRSWRETVALFDQTHHMQGVFVSGPDARKFLGYISCNSLFKSTPNKASQIICTDKLGRLIGDGIVFHLEENLLSIYGAPMVPTWVQYCAETLGFDVTAKVDARSPVYANGHGNTRPNCRYQIQGPLAGKLIEKLNGGPLGDVKFFGMCEIRIGKQTCRALRHGMAGALGLELWGPWEHRDEIRNTIIEAGQEFGLCLVGGMAYLVPAIESGWYQGVLPAIFSGDEMQQFRRWVPADEHNSLIRLQGTKVYPTVDGYYRTPYDLGLGSFVNLDHECIGRDALAGMDPAKATKKVTLAWNVDDAAGLFREMLSPGGRNVRFLHLPANCDTIGLQYDELKAGAQDAGVAAYTAYSANERAILSMALIHPDVEIGETLTISWGEAGGGHGRFMMPATEKYEVRAVVSPAPYSKVAREVYRKAALA
jgi:vanillate/3-O-methylgallate O-demethylase